MGKKWAFRFCDLLTISQHLIEVHTSKDLTHWPQREISAQIEKWILKITRNFLHILVKQCLKKVEILSYLIRIIVFLVILPSLTTSLKYINIWKYFKKRWSSYSDMISWMHNFTTYSLETMPLELTREPLLLFTYITFWSLKHLTKTYYRT